MNPGFGTGFWMSLDAAGTALPVPTIAGYAKNGTRAYKILKYFDKVASEAGKKASDIAGTFLKNALYNQIGKQWSKGLAGDSLANL